MGGKKMAYDWMEKSARRFLDDFDKGKNIKKGTQHTGIDPNKPPRMPKTKIVPEKELSPVTRAKQIYKRLTGGKRTKPDKPEPKEVIRKQKPRARMTAKELQERNKKIAEQKKSESKETKPKKETKKKATKKKTTKKKNKDKSVTASKDDLPY